MRYSAFRLYNIPHTEERNGTILTIHTPRMVELEPIYSTSAEKALAVLHLRDPSFPHYLHAIGAPK